MGNKQIRVGQLIAPFGPGSLYTDRRGIPHVVCGLDHWYMRWDQTLGLVACENRSEFERVEPRLSSLLHVDRFCVPPDYRHVRRGASAPPNAMLHVPALRFPCWYRHTRTGQMRKFNLHTTRIERPADGGRWQPVRFVSVCAGGHLSEFPWKEWIGCQCADEMNFVLTDRGGSELSSIRVECLSCPSGSPGRRGRTLAGTTVKPDLGEQSALQQAGITCSGARPWLGEGANEAQCNQPLIGALINQTNLYFPKTISAIALPDLQPQSDAVANLRNEIEVEPTLGVARTLWNMGNRAETVAMIQAALANRGVASRSAQVEEALDSLFNPSGAALPTGAALPLNPESELLAFRRAEFNILRHEINDPDRVPNLRVIPTDVPNELAPWISDVNLVERLRETRAFFGFDRLAQDNNNSLVGMPETAMRQLFRNPPTQPQDRWLPAVEVFGEGIYVELNEQAIVEWQTNETEWLANRLDDGFVTRLGGIFQTLPPLNQASRAWSSRYLLVHSLAHILINQLVFECGYSTASLRERLYISGDTQAPMAAFLIYTSAGDSDGTLGGLVSLGRPERLTPLVLRAIDRASWCSADPVCSENLGGQGSRLANLAACHACILLPETACETINQGLDRAMIVGTPEEREHGLLSSLLENSFTLA